jgi:hypothetical protein
LGGFVAIENSIIHGRVSIALTQGKQRGKSL